MNLQSILLLVGILAVIVSLIRKEWKRKSQGKAPCFTCTVTDCPLAGLPIQNQQHRLRANCVQSSSLKMQASALQERSQEPSAKVKWNG
ncbi:hypothetical protein HZY91_08170 [Facklamia sp. DSM 111018]|uniref:FeoB-associated Cys-rich membrane protein n=1 Tax=Facklamia lactis TaxID=2749967 RepID=A0ABS0LRS6_9LACT|nr:hypothetical protein [Facklamia lactis]MBG9986860.1 hypothetical protein [Facklamia lactis]